MVVKKDGRREKFDRQKVLSGLLKACEKRPVSMTRLAELVDEVEGRLADKADREITTTEIGELLMRAPGRPSTRSPTSASLLSIAISRTSRHS